MKRITLLFLTVLVSKLIFAQCSTPVINSFTPNTGFIGSTVTITGAFFDPTPANNQVFFGATQATVLASSFGSLTVIAPVGSTTALISVKNGCGRIAYSKAPFNGIFCPTPIDASTYQNVAFELTGIYGAYNMLSQDMDLDGKPDVISAGFSGITVAKNNSTPGTISFVAVNIAPNTQSVAVGDMDGDGKRDIIVTSNGGISIVRNLSTPGTMSFSSPFVIPNFGPGTYQCAVGDLNNDGKIDIATGAGSNVYTLINTSTGAGVISFNQGTVVDVSGHCTGLQVADVDGDGVADILGTQGGNNRAVSVRNTTSGGSGSLTFESAEFWASNGDYPYRCQIADFDKDGKIDLTTCNYNGATNTAIFRNTSTSGDISFATTVNLAAPTANYRIGVGDVNGDGLPDIVTKSLGVNVFSVYPNTSTGPGNVSFGARFDYSSSSTAEVSGIVIGDLDGDYVPDIGTSGINSNTIRFHRNTSSQQDVTNPTAICKNITVALSPSGTATVTAAMIDNGSSDACGIGSLAINGSASVSYTCANIGANTATLTVTDRAGNTSTCTATINVAPAAIIASGQTTVCQGQTVTLTANLGDSYQWHLNGSPISGATAQTYVATGSGDYTVTVTNAGGCSGTSSATTVSISAVTPATISASGPVDLCQGNTVTLTASAGNAFVWSNGASSQSITVGTAGNYSVTVYNASGCSSTSAPTSVTIKSGSIPTAAISVGGSTSFCAGGNVAITATESGNSYLWSNGATTQTATFNQSGTYTVTVTNAQGCFKVSQPTTVTVKPVPTVAASADVTTCSSAAQLNATGNPNGAPVTPVTQTYCMFDQAGGQGNCNFTADLCNDNYSWVSNASYSQAVSASSVNGLNFKLYFTCGPATYTFFLNGTNIGSYSYNGAQCTCQPQGAGTYPFTQSFTQAQVSSLWNSSGSNTLRVDVSSGSGTALAGIVAEVLVPGETYVWSPSAGLSNANIKNPTALPANTTTYTVTYTTGNGCSATDDVKVTIQCNTAPVASCKAVTVSAGNDCKGTATASDFNDGSSDAEGDALTFSVSPAGPYSIGTTNITLTVTDTKNASSTCNTTITVEDNTAPTVLTKNLSVNLSSSGTVSITASQIDSGSTDNCGIDSITVSPNSFSCAQVGSNTVTLRVKDIHGNVATGTATVMVSDVTAPSAVAKNISVDLSATGSATITAAQVNDGSSDECGIKSLAVSPSSFTCANVGANTVTLTVTDNNDNVSTATATVTINDVTAPGAVAKNITVNLDTTGAASITAAQVNDGSADACGIKSLAVSPSSFTCSNVGANTVTLTVTDNNNNVSTTTSTVTIKDVTAPNAIAQNLSINLSSSGAASITAAQINNGSSDACGIKSVSVSPSSFTCAEVGNNTVTLTVTDNNDNVSTATSTVTVSDVTAPAAIAQNVTVTLSGGTASVSATDINNGSSDACGIASMDVSPSSFDCSDIGDNTVTLTVTDANGNVSSTTATVSVVGAIPTVSITQGVQPGFTQGGAIVLTASSPTAVGYSWNAGPANAVYNVYASGIYSVTATNSYGCTVNGSTTVSYNASNLLSSYVIIGKEEVKLEDHVTVFNGGVGVTGNCGEVEVEDQSTITASGTFVRAKKIEVKCNSAVSTKIFTAAPTNIIPPFLYNPYCGSSSCGHNHHGQHNHHNHGCNNSHHNSCNHNSHNCSHSHHQSNCGNNCNHSHHSTCNNHGNNSNNNKNIGQNTTVTITDSIMGTVVIGRNATVTFTAPQIYIKGLEIKDGATVNFTNCAVIRICNHAKIGEDVEFNTGNNSIVSMYVEKKFEVKEGSNVTANVYSREDIKINGKYNAITTMKGLFIGDEVKAEKYVRFYWNPNTTCTNSNYKSAFVADEGGLVTNYFEADVYPNPAVNQFNLRLFSSSTDAYSVDVYDINGRLLDSHQVTDSNLHVEMGEKYADGMYFIKVTQGDMTKTLRLVKTTH